eukprot:GHVL01036367.1.p2 GENE.GHVL01036367.1~~GHVL01036367.1.p2  ORF type:complete len:114 (-),score=17.29 GHVL01036367.1:395-736(-)
MAAATETHSVSSIQEAGSPCASQTLSVESKHKHKKKNRRSVFTSAPSMSTADASYSSTLHNNSDKTTFESCPSTSVAEYGHSKPASKIAEEPSTFESQPDVSCASYSQSDSYI